MALQRFDSRSEAVIEEANAIGTAYLRTQLLPGEARAEARKLIEAYIEVRLQASKVELIQVEARRKAKAEAHGHGPARADLRRAHYSPAKTPVTAPISD